MMESPYREGVINLDSVRNTQHELGEILAMQPNAYDRQKAAVYYADLYRQELDMMGELEPQQQPAAVMNRLFLSSIISTAQMRRFISAGYILGESDSYTDSRKQIFLDARKDFQTEVDKFFDYFSYENTSVRGDGLRDIVAMSREVVRGRSSDMVGALYLHNFLGSIVSERAIKMSLQKYIHQDTRYGTTEEDRSPNMADVVIPLPEGNMPIQVKMRTTEGAEFAVRPMRITPHVFMPMPVTSGLRSELTPAEDVILALGVDNARYYGQWRPLQTGANQLELAA